MKTEKKIAVVRLLVPKRPGNEFDEKLPDFVELKFDVTEPVVSPMRTNAESYDKHVGGTLTEMLYPASKYLACLIAFREQFGFSPQEALSDCYDCFEWDGVTIRPAFFSDSFACPISWDAMVREAAHQQLSQEKNMQLFEKLKSMFSSEEEPEEKTAPSVN